MNYQFWLFVRGALLLSGFLFTLPAQATFTVNGDGTVTDSATGLIWDQCAWGQSGATCMSGSSWVHNWSQALGEAVTANAMNGGAGYKNHADWRLPNKNELESIVDLFHSGPAINSSVFPGTDSANPYWSSTSNVLSVAAGWLVSFSQGQAYADSIAVNGYVRLVRGGLLFGSFDAQAPWSPGNVVAVLGNAKATVTFSAPGSNGAVVSGYTVHAFTTDGTGAMQSQSVLGTDIDAGSLRLSHTFLGLVNGTAYTFTVTAHGSQGDSQESMRSNAIVPSPEAGAPVCTLVATPATVHPGRSSTLTPTCSPAAITYTWNGGTCVGITAPTCNVTPAMTTSYSVTGTNSYGSSTANAQVTVKAVDLTPILMLLLY